jgi:DNA-directed RNA polymerase specialized sigma24 family protein
MLAQPNVAKPPSSALNIAELADRYAGLLYSIGRRYRLTPEECDDAAQSTWLALCQSAEQIRDPQCVAGWLATTMRRFSAAALRTRYREHRCADQRTETFAPVSPSERQLR